MLVQTRMPWSPKRLESESLRGLKKALNRERGRRMVAKMVRRWLGRRNCLLRKQWPK